ncbi:hypothetical protein MKW11_14890 [Gluconobacter frateurii]|uniref:hypothetical protein n=1 Tax=Gluconobacter frateurii TaxID=38308 RepID=UPI001F06E81C|nr:hypothetical protein [Gluconobacter frateurii]UMM08452.1 hypothetical protein MKW11_14890 [Gluconobacter frateurii]
MAAENRRKKLPKTESLTIRLDPKMRFALEFVARLKGQTITKVIERAIADAADNTRVFSENNYSDNSTWRSYWDVNEGIRFIKLTMDEATDPSFEDEETLVFIKQHWRYFSNDERLIDLKRDYIEVLWPLIPSIMEEWREVKSTNRPCIISRMEDALLEAGLPSMIPDEEIPF